MKILDNYMNIICDPVAKEPHKFPYTIAFAEILWAHMDGEYLKDVEAMNDKLSYVVSRLSLFFEHNKGKLSEDVSKQIADVLSCAKDMI